nr:uncharacterized protein LOC117855560 isoform X2 [Setaria viridis]
MLPAANVTARQRGRGSGGALRLAAVVLLVALLALCLARADAAASLSPAGRAPSSEKVVESASLENARGQCQQVSCHLLSESKSWFFSTAKIATCHFKAIRPDYGFANPK